MDAQIVILRSGRQLLLSLISPYKDVAADAGPHGFAGMVYSKGQDQDMPPSVANEVTLVSSHRHPCQRNVFSVLGGGDRRRDEHLESLSRCPLRLLFFSQMR